MNFKEELKKTLNIDLTDEKEAKFEMYYEEIKRVNSYMDLTNIIEHDEVYIKHFYDSLTVTKAIPFKKIKLCDVGSGAGFPGIPLAICYDEMEVTMIDSNGKRVDFINEIAGKLGLTNVRCFQKRAEESVAIARSIYDVVTARAVAKLNILDELCLPLVKIGGYFIAMKGKDVSEEIDDAKKGIAVLGGKLLNTVSFELPEGAGTRSLVIIKRVKECNSKYPRQYNQISSKPL